MLLAISRILIAAAGTGLSISCAVSVHAGDNLLVRQGTDLVAARCAQCHAIDGISRSTHPAAPPFRDLHKRYRVEFLAEALAEGLVTGHPDMPEQVLEPNEIEALIAYLGSFAAK